MDHQKSPTVNAGVTRRDFLKQTGGAVVVGTGLCTFARSAQSRGIFLLPDPADPVLAERPVRRALEQLRNTLTSRGISSRLGESLDTVSPTDEIVLVARPGSSLARPVLGNAGISIPEVAEALALVRGEVESRQALLVCGSDVRGLVYGLLEVADRVAYSSEPEAVFRSPDRIVETPANPVRSVTRYFTSDVEDKPWFYDKSFWTAYLSMLVAQRFNRFSLAFGLAYNSPRNVHDVYFYFTYPFLFAVPGYQVRAAGLPDEERERNLAMLRWIAEEATDRGLHFQLALWNHAYAWIDSPKANYTIEGLDKENHARYCRDALRTLLETCPAIQGVTLRAHSESGIPEGSYDFWQALFEGIKQAGRPVEIDIHSKGIEHKLLRMALETGNPVNVSPKYWAEHMGLPYHQASIRELERASRGDRIEQQRRFTRYGYGDYLREDRAYGVLYRIWPGTQRLLLWGDPAMAAGYGRYAHFCGSLGVELSEPLSFKGRMGSGLPGGRNAYADVSLETAGGDWEKHAYTYRLWGRLLYNPDATSETWRRFLKSDFGAAAPSCEAALAHASRILPLVTVAHHPSASNNRYWPEIYTDMPISDTEDPPYGDTPSPRRFGTVSPLDPALFSTVEEFADHLMDRRPDGRYSPLDVARWLETDAQTAETRLAEARSRTRDSKGAPFRRLAIDVSIQSGLGHFFAQKLRAAVAYALYERAGEPSLLEKAVEHYRLARDAWKKVIAITEGVYRKDITYGLAPHLRGHWADRLPAIERDLSEIEARLKAKPAASGSEGEQHRLPLDLDLGALFAASPGAPPACRHEPPTSFQPGEPIPLAVSVEAGHELAGVRIHYRHVNQQEAYRIEEMRASGSRRYEGEIPGEYTASPYPLLYFFELCQRQGRAWLYPGFQADLMNQPYFVVRQSRNVS